MFGDDISEFMIAAQVVDAMGRIFPANLEVRNRVYVDKMKLNLGGAQMHYQKEQETCTSC